MFALLLVGCKATTTTQSITNGNVVFGITDELTGNIESLIVHIDSLMLYGINNNFYSTAVNKDYDLIKLNSLAVIEEMGNISAPEGIYNLVVLDISKVTVTMNNLSSPVILPSSKLKIPLNHNIEKSKTNAIIFDFKASESLHMTGNGKIIMLPVFKVDEREIIVMTKNSLKQINIVSSLRQRVRTMITDVKGISGEDRVVIAEDIRSIVVDANPSIICSILKLVPGASTCQDGVFRDIRDNPTVCTAIYQPVCSASGITFPNECTAKSLGHTITSQGECTKTIIVDKTMV